MSSSEVAGREGLGQDGLEGLHGSKVAVSLCLDKSFVFVLACGIEPGPSAGKVQSPNHWTAKEFPCHLSFACSYSKEDLMEMVKCF